MIDFETYKDETDKSVKNKEICDVPVSKSAIYKGDLRNIIKEKDLGCQDIPPLAAAVVGLKNTSAVLSTSSKFSDCWTDIDAQESYLNSKPTCYLILGKPGAGAYSLGEAMSKRLNCIHLCPKNIISDEIERYGATGKCLAFNLRHQNVIKFDVILEIMKQKLKSPAVTHRGCVISGLPLIAADRNPYYLSDTLYSEESVLINGDLIEVMLDSLKKKKARKTNSSASSQQTAVSNEEIQEEEELEEEQEPEIIPEEGEDLIVALPKFILELCSDIIFSRKPQVLTKQSVFLEQVESLLNSPFEPDIVIYLTSPDKDLVVKKSRKYYNYRNNVYTFDTFPTNHDTEIRWPADCNISDYTSPYDSHTLVQAKYYCRHPINFTHKSTEQLCNYKNYVLPYLEHKLQDFDPTHVIKLDARISVHQMMHHVNEKLLTLSIKPVLIPEPLYLEESSEETDEFWRLVEDLNVIRCGNVHFNRFPSLWFNRCPVELKKRRSQRGLPKFSVTFFKHVYLLSSLENMIEFCRNPRPYLNLKYLEPTCRVIVIGTKLSGKTMMSNCLSWLFDAPIINYEVFVKAQREKKYNTFAMTILSEIIATIEDARLLKWKNQETERIIKLGAWDKANFDIFETYVKLFLDILKYSNKEIVTEKDEEEIQEVPEELSPLLMDNFSDLKNRLSFIPFLEDIDQCMNAVKTKTLLQYAPYELTTGIEKPSTPVLGDEDVTLAIRDYISSNDLHKEIEPTNEELMNEMVKVLLENDENSLRNSETYKQFIIDGFPPEPELWGYLSDAKLLPDHTIALIENREVESELLEYYSNISKQHKNHQERIVLATDPLVKTKLMSKIFPAADVAAVPSIVKLSISTMLDAIFIETPELNKTEYASFSADIDKFREDWDSLKSKLEENNKLFIEIQLENKTDVEVIDEVLLNMRKNYYLTPESVENEESEPPDDEDESFKDILTYNDPRNLCETNIYCPIAFYSYGVLWEGKPKFCCKQNNKLHYLCKEECFGLFQKDITRYQEYNKPFKTFPPLRVCVIGCLGSGKTTVSKLISKEFGLMHLDFSDIINTLLMPRHFKKVGRQYENIFTDTPIEDEAFMEFQIDEENDNLVSDILGNETEFRRMIYNYFERGTPILSVLLQNLLKKIWFEKPFVDTGFILDGFPRLRSDVEDMVSCFCIPDLIIEIEGSSESMLQRLSENMHETWRTQLKEAKYKVKVRHDLEMQEWMNFITKNVIAKLIYEEILDNLDTSTEEPPTTLLSTASVIIDAHPQGSSNVDVNLFTFYNQMILDYPAPIDSSEWENPNDARERIDARLESVYEVEDEGIQSLKDTLLEQRIKILSIDGTKRLDKVLRIVLFKLASLRNRSLSFLEQTFVIDCDISEMLLLEGFFFFSKFHRMCPVYIFENRNAILNPFKIKKRKDKVFPVIHRAYIYFIFGEENLQKFRNDPLKYVSSEVIYTFKEYPLTISVIGPPKSGKTVLASKLAKRYGLIYISRGTAVRYVLEHMYWTELGSRMKDVLCKGECVNYELIMKAVQTAAIDHRTTTCGFVFDGFPEFAAEAMELMNSGLYPNIVFDISTDKNQVIKNSLDEIYYNVIKLNPPYSTSHIEYIYNSWSERSYQIRNWIQEDVQNLYHINGKGSRWQCLKDATSYIDNTFTNSIHYYLNNVNKKIVLTKCMCITNEAFSKRMSPFKDLCPLCLKKNVLRNSSQPVDKKGVVQFRNTFYWICPSHMDAVLKYPERHLILNEEIEIPEIPVAVKTVNVTFVYERGICIVTYAQNLPNQRVVMGCHKYAASYKGKTYMFCNAKCLDMFLATPHLYYDITVLQMDNMFPPICLKKLPNIGYLEQTVGNIITDACCSLNVSRPKYPGLDIKLSGLLYIALYLKTHNPNGTKDFNPLYDKASEIYAARCKLIVDVGLRMRSMDNPFAKYPKCCNKLRSLGSGTVRKPSSVDEYFSDITITSEFR